MHLKTRELPYQQEINEYVKQLIQHIRPRAVILYGSVARGTFGVGSDIDIMIIADSLPQRFLDRLTLLYELNKSGAPIEPVGYTSSEIDRMMLKGQPALYDALEEGIDLYDDDFLDQARRTWESMKSEKGWTKTKIGWTRTKP